MPTRDDDLTAHVASDRHGAVSIALGVLGLIGYWGTMATLFVIVWRSLNRSTAETDAVVPFTTYQTAGRIAFFGSLATHVLGLAVTFASPPGKRKPGRILNGLPLLFLLGLVILNLLRGR